MISESGLNAAGVYLLGIVVVDMGLCSAWVQHGFSMGLWATWICVRVGWVGCVISESDF